MIPNSSKILVASSIMFSAVWEELKGLRARRTQTREFVSGSYMCPVNPMYELLSLKLLHMSVVEWTALTLSRRAISF